MEKKKRGLMIFVEFLGHFYLKAKVFNIQF
jgi:hypothetical protein